jgi:hypothetical protein
MRNLRQNTTIARIHSIGNQHRVLRYALESGGKSRTIYDTVQVDYNRAGAGYKSCYCIVNKFVTVM